MLVKLVDFWYILYKGFSPVKDTILYQHFGFVSQCRHNPPCSDYLKIMTKKKGWRGFLQGIKRVLTCI